VPAAGPVDESFPPPDAPDPVKGNWTIGDVVNLCEAVNEFEDVRQECTGPLSLGCPLMPLHGRSPGAGLGPVEPRSMESVDVSSACVDEIGPVEFTGPDGVRYLGLLTLRSGSPSADERRETPMESRRVRRIQDAGPIAVHRSK